MAASRGYLRFLCRSCRESISKTPQSQNRAFTTSIPRARTSVAPVFNETSSEELNNILLDFREKVFKPASLSKTHQNLIYKKKHRHFIEGEPGVTVTLANDEQYKLEPLQRWDRPKKHAALKALVKVLEKGDDINTWENLPRFLQGLVMAKDTIPKIFLEKVTRKANEVGRTGIIKNCAEMPKRTGVRLSIPGVTIELFLGIHSRAVAANFEGKGLDRAVEQAEGLAYLLEQEDHCGGKLAPGELDMRKHPFVIAVLLELRAAQAMGQHSGRDVDGQVTSDMRKLISILNTTNILDAVNEAGLRDRTVEIWIPIANAIRMAIQVDDLEGGQRDAATKLKMDLKRHLDAFDQAITEQVEIITKEAAGKPRRVLNLLEALKQR